MTALNSPNAHKWLKRFTGSGLSALLIGILAIYLASILMVGDKQTHPPVLSTRPTSTPDPQIGQKSSLRVMTLNLAHGRREGPHQVFQSGPSIQVNLDDVARALNRWEPDVIALQEADGPSFWSGSFDHVQYLARRTLPYAVQGEHVKRLNTSYGTAFLSALPLKDTLSITFAPSPPTFSKGFLLTTVAWPDGSGRTVDVVSVHLDFSRQSVRKKQIDEMIRILSTRSNPLIVMGDFNSDWTSADSPVRKLAQGLELEPYEPQSPNLETYAPLNHRFDWILISDELAFKTYELVPDRISDHRAVVADIVFQAPD